MSSQRTSTAAFFLAFAALVVAIHLPYLRLPFFWDEMGQFIPAALDLYRDGAWVPHSTQPNAHPPGLMVVLALVWRIFGFSIAATRLTMLAIASAGALLAFLLSIRLSRGTDGAPAFAAVLFLLASPIFYTQAMLAQLDMPAMVLTTLALLLFLEAHYAASAAACAALVLVKETAISTPLVFAAWLWFRDRRRREALYFLAPALALGVWLILLTRTTGHILGSAEFTSYNVYESLNPVHIALSLGRRVYYLFIGDGHFIGTLAIFVGWRVLRGREWTITALVGLAQVAVVTVLGGAMLERYLLPVLPIVCAAMAATASVYPSSWRWVSHTALVAALLLGWFWNPPYPFPLENNLAMTDFVRLQQDAAGFLEAWAPDRTVATTWPLTDALRRPEFGYVRRPLHVAVDRGRADVLVVFSRDSQFEEFFRRYLDYHPGASPGLGYVPVARWRRGGQWIDVYVPEPN